MASEQLCKAETLQDTFVGNQPGDPWRASDLNFCDVAAVGGGVRLTLASQSATCEYASSAAYDLTDSSFTVHVHPGTPSANEIYVFARLDADNWIEARAEDPNLTLRAAVNGEEMSNSYGLPSGNFWIALRESGGMVLLETSKDAKTWSTVNSITAPIPLGSVRLGFGVWGQDVGMSASFSELNAAAP
jgi:hypothetical protein